MNFDLLPDKTPGFIVKLSNAFLLHQPLKLTYYNSMQTTTLKVRD